VKPFLDQHRWSEVIDGFDIIDLAVQDINVIQIAARKKLPHREASLMFDSEIPTRIITLFTDRPEGNNCGYQQLEGMPFPVLGVSRAPFPRPSGLLACNSMDGDVWPRGSGYDGPLEQIAPNQQPRPERLKCINGFTYSIGGWRKIYKRIAIGHWVKLDQGFPEITQYTNSLGFKDLDAFSESDMYAVGGDGDVWHFNGTRWEQMGFPSNVQLGTVTCAGDGKVYITGEGGSMWAGSKSTWKLVHEAESSVLWNDVLWFQEKLWLASDYHLRQWNGKEMVTVEQAGQQVNIWGHMDAYDGVLAVASPNYVMSFDGAQWRTLVAPYA
jgi:hypothetical protein